MSRNSRTPPSTCSRRWWRSFLGKGGGGLPALRHHVQRDRDPGSLPAGEDDRASHRASHPLRVGRARRAGRGQRAGGGRPRAASSTRRHSGGGHPLARGTLLPAEPAPLGGADRRISGGGSIWPLRQIEAVTAVAKSRGLKTHMDGARLMNAVVASGVAARDFAAPFDSAWIDFTKGLGAPVGAALARLARVQSTRPGDSSSRWAAPCARPESSPRAASAPSATM